MSGPWEHNRWRWAYAYGACGWAPAPPEDCDHWSPDLQARAFAAADDEEYADWWTAWVDMLCDWHNG